MLRLLLADPNRVWRVMPLAAKAQVSLGQVSSLRRRLLDQEWAVVQKDGFRLSRPRELLEAWRQAHRLDPEQSGSAYTLLHGDALDKALRAALVEAGDGRDAVLASYSAGRWLALFRALRQDASGCKRAFDRFAEHFLPGRYDPAAFSLLLAHKDVSLSVGLTRGQGVPMKIGEAKSSPRP